jgi:hypothetical protein
VFLERVELQGRGQSDDARLLQIKLLTIKLPLGVPTGR